MNEPATKKQIKYAKSLGINIPPNANKIDLSFLIDAKLNNDKQASKQLRSLAEIYGIKINKYAGEKILFDMIYGVLSSPGRELDLVSWFAYCVCQGLRGKKNISPKSPIIQKIAEQLSDDEQVLRSIRRYDGWELLGFGEINYGNGVIRYGGSKRTLAYKRIKAMLENASKYLPKNYSTSEPQNIPMEKCPKCGYMRQEKDNEFFSEKECPKCGIFYDQYWNSINKISHLKSLPDKKKKSKNSQKTKIKKKPPFFAFLIIAVLIFVLYSLIQEMHLPRPVHIELKDITRLYRKNPTLADQKYKDKRITTWFIASGNSFFHGQPAVNVPYCIFIFKHKSLAKKYHLFSRGDVTCYCRGMREDKILFDGCR